MQLNQVTIGVCDLHRAIAFYRALGLHLIVHANEQYARFEMPGGEGATFSVHLVERVMPATTLVYFEVDDVDAATTLAIQSGATLKLPPTDQTWLWREAHLTDPFGNPFCLYHAGPHRRFPPWRHSDTASDTREAPS